MAWIIARLREDTTRAALGQIGIVLALLGLALGVDIGALLTQAEDAADRVVALLGVALAASAQVARIITPDRPPPGADAVAKAVDLIREAGRP